jgi:hypothetical protein
MSQLCVEWWFRLYISLSRIKKKARRFWSKLRARGSSFTRAHNCDQKRRSFIRDIASVICNVLHARKKHTSPQKTHTQQNPHKIWGNAVTIWKVQKSRVKLGFQIATRRRPSTHFTCALCPGAHATRPVPAVSECMCIRTATAHSEELIELPN